MRRRRRLERGRCKSQSADVRRVTIEAAATRFHYYDNPSPVVGRP